MSKLTLRALPEQDRVCLHHESAFGKPRDKKSQESRPPSLSSLKHLTTSPRERHKQGRHVRALNDLGAHQQGRCGLNRASFPSNKLVPFVSVTVYLGIVLARLHQNAPLYRSRVKFNARGNFQNLLRTIGGGPSLVHRRCSCTWPYEVTEPPPLLASPPSGARLLPTAASSWLLYR
jgi:hypothetical protein